MHIVYKYCYAMQRINAHSFKQLSAVQYMGNKISHFLSSYQDISLIVKYNVTCQLNVQVNYIVQRYQF